MRSRISGATIVAVVVLVAAAMFHGSPGADADQGEAVIAGWTNTEERTTILKSGDGDCPRITDSALEGCGFGGLFGSGTSYGVVGQALTGTAGVSGRSGYIGVQGTTTGPFGVGVVGEGGAIGVSAEGTENGVRATGGTSGIYAEGETYGVYGRGAYGVLGHSSTGVGVGARALSAGTALKVMGKAEFSRSGKAVVPGTIASPRSFVVVPNVTLAENSLVMVTPQKTMAGVFVLGAVPNVRGSTVRIVLNEAVTVSYPVAWFVIESPS